MGRPLSPLALRALVEVTLLSCRLMRCPRVTQSAVHSAASHAQSCYHCSVGTARAWPQDRSGRSLTLEQGSKGALGPQGDKIARVPWPSAPRAPKGPVKEAPGSYRQSGRSWGPRAPGTQDRQGTLENSRVDLGPCPSCKIQRLQACPQSLRHAHPPLWVPQREEVTVAQRRLVSTSPRHAGLHSRILVART